MTWRLITYAVRDVQINALKAKARRREGHHQLDVEIDKSSSKSTTFSNLNGAFY